MSRYNSGPLWSISRLKRRGWTTELIRELLPPPRRAWHGGHASKAWERSVVQAAEEDPRFQAVRDASDAAPVQNPTPLHPAPRAADALDRAWENARREDTPRWRLAAQYHRAVTARLRTGTGVRRLRTAQAEGCLGEFFTLGRRVERIGELLQFLIRAGLWLENNPFQPVTKKLYEQYTGTLVQGAERALDAFLSAQPGADVDAMLRRDDFPAELLLREPLATVWSVWYVPIAIRTSLSLLVALNPRDEYPEARAMRRHFILHLGGTNTGKTYAGFQRLKRAPSGVYLAPLRLLALEAQETLLDAGVNCSLTTGEEEDRRAGDTHVAATAEKLDLRQIYDVAVIDECQMIADRQRGYAWTRAILGVLSREVHLCAAPQAKALLIRLIESCGDTWEIEEHRRTTPLLCMNRTVDFDHVQPGDALITFSKLGVLSIAEDLRQAGKEPAIIYGALPYPADYLHGQPEIRRRGAAGPEAGGNPADCRARGAVRDVRQGLCRRDGESRLHPRRTGSRHSALTGGRGGLLRFGPPGGF